MVWYSHLFNINFPQFVENCYLLRPFRYDLSQIPYDYTVEVTNRFKGLDLIERVTEELQQRFMTLYRRQSSRPSPRKRNAERQMVA